MLLSVSVRLVLKVLDEIQYHSEIPDSTSWESNSDSMTAVYLTELYMFFTYLAPTYKKAGLGTSTI